MGEFLSQFGAGQDFGVSGGLDRAGTAAAGLGAFTVGKEFLPQAAKTGGGFLGGLSGFFGGPIPGLLGMVGSGINAFLSYRQRKKQGKESKRRWEATMAMQQKQMDMNWFINKEKLKMSKKQYYQSMKDAYEQKKEYYEQKNYTRAGDMSNRLNSMLNSSQNLSNMFVNKWRSA